MDQADRREIRELRERLSKLSEASLRINESLDFETVLQGVLDSARSLTGARYGVIILLDDAGGIQDFLTSGLTPEETRRLWEVPGGRGLFEYVVGTAGPLRVRDFQSHMRSLGLAELSLPMPVGAVFPFLAAPVRHRGEGVGNFFLAQKEGGRRVHPRGRGDPGDVRLPGGAGHRQRPPLPGRAAGQDRPGDPDQHRSRGGGGLRREDRGAGFLCTEYSAIRTDSGAF